MSKYGIFGIIMLWLLFATYLVNSFSAYLEDDTFIVNNPIGDITTEGASDIGTIKGMSSTFTDAISFNVVGLPPIISLFCFTVPSFILAYMTLEILIKILDVVVPF